MDTVMDTAGFVAAPGITRHHHTLADGRDLIYFDDPDTRLSPERAADTRMLDPRPPTASMRQDPLSGEWVSIASARQNRVFLPPANLDPLAPSTPENPSEVPSNYDVAVFENKSPSFGPALGAVDLHGVGFERSHPSVGRRLGCHLPIFAYFLLVINQKPLVSVAQIR